MRLSETIFNIFISCNSFLESATDSAKYIGQTEVLVQCHVCLQDGNNHLDTNMGDLPVMIIVIKIHNQDFSNFEMP